MYHFCSIPAGASECSCFFGDSEMEFASWSCTRGKQFSGQPCLYTVGDRQSLPGAAPSTACPRFLRAELMPFSDFPPFEQSWKLAVLQRAVLTHGNSHFVTSLTMLWHLTYPPIYDSSHLSFLFYTPTSLGVFCKVFYRQRSSGVWCQCVRQYQASACHCSLVLENSGVQLPCMQQ